MNFEREKNMYMTLHEYLRRWIYYLIVI